MSLLSYNRLCELVEQGIITADPENINSSSIDITLDDVIMIEQITDFGNSVIDLSKKQNIAIREQQLDLSGYPLQPGEFILASSKEFFNLPNNISAEYKLKSSMARNGLEHLNAGWCDAGWHGSKLTLELKNITNYHTLLIKPGIKIGQMVFFEHEPVPNHASYATKGRYNKQTQVTAAKGIR